MSGDHKTPGGEAMPVACDPSVEGSGPDAGALAAPSGPDDRTTHECVFVEEQEPTGRLVLPPCIVCGCAAMDALIQLRDEGELSSLNAH